MIDIGLEAPDFDLPDQFGCRFRLRDFRAKRNVLVLFFPAAFTITCAREVPELAALSPQLLRETNTQAAAVSTDSRHSHNAWACDLGGLKLPILSDQWPYGRVSEAYGSFVRAEGVADRGTVLIDPSGVVRYAHSVGIDGRRDMRRLFELARRVGGPGPEAPRAWCPDRAGAGRDVVFLEQGCGACVAVLRALRNLRAERRVAVRWIDEPRAARALESVTGPDLPTPTAVLVDPRSPRGARVLTGRDAVVEVLAARYR